MQWLWGIAGLLTAASAIWAYSALVSDRELVKAGWRNIEGHLKRRHEYLTKLAEAVREHCDFAPAQLEAVESLLQESESARGPLALQQAEEAISRSLRQFVAIADAYPSLQAETSFVDAQRLISLIEADVVRARDEYNKVVRRYNRETNAFPQILISRTMGFGLAEEFSLDL